MSFSIHVPRAFVLCQKVLVKEQKGFLTSTLKSDIAFRQVTLSEVSDTKARHCDTLPVMFKMEIYVYP